MTTEVSEEATPQVNTFWTPRRVARMAIFIALAAVGALIKFPSPTGTVALDSAPGYFSAISFGWLEGGIVSAFGHILTAASTGFPLGLVIHLIIAAEQFLWAAIFWFVKEKVNIWVAIIVAAFCNGVLGALIVLPMGGVGLYISLLPGLLVGSAVNIILAALAYLSISKSGLLK
ncbi:MAG: ECF transporter S component [Anaerolineales bacterium]|uniref:ECF transporter S component n=1 Tax=Candidatus Desulfolinea nitratireducens TaxID=2841698 RepID=A0A8J6TGP8_9CHLR|nr:ECF transporter S component [Candidatus Desulfolinea nitratireducens]